MFTITIVLAETRILDVSLWLEALKCCINLQTLVSNHSMYYKLDTDYTDAQTPC